MTFGSGGGGDNSMTVRISGDASGAVSASSAAANSFMTLPIAAAEAAAKTNEALSSIGAAGQQAFTGPQGLATTTQLATEAMGRSLGGGPSGILSIFGGLQQGLAGAVDSVEGFAGKIFKALNPLNLFHSSVLRLVEVMSLWRLFDQGLSSVTNFVEGIWKLPIAMEKAQGSWQYMFNTPIAQGQSLSQWMGQGQGIAQQLSDWTMKASISLPYTRQDLISAITSLAPAGLSSQGIEHYLPVIGDLAAAMNPNLSLQQASYSVMGAMMGYSRMLRYDLHINPEQLQQYGYDASNNATLLPALQKFAEARGITSYDSSGKDVGAAYNISHSTFWGEYSSLLDRIQNSQIMTGDYGPFQSLKKGLEWVNGFIDTHSTDIEKFSHLLGDTLSNGMQSVANAGAALVDGLSKTGVLSSFVSAFGDLGTWLGNPNTQKGIDSLLQLAGKDIGISLGGIGHGASAAGTGVGAAWTALGGKGQGGLVNALTIPGMLADVVGQEVGGAGSSIGHGVKSFQDLFSGNFGGALSEWGSSMSSLIAPTGGIYDTIMNWAAPGHPELQGGKKTMDSWLSNVGGFLSSMGKDTGTGASGYGQWLSGLGGDVATGASGYGQWLGGIGGDVGSWFGGLRWGYPTKPSTAPGFPTGGHGGQHGGFGGDILGTITSLIPQLGQLGSAFDGAGKAFTGFETGLQQKAAAIKDHITTMISSITDPMLKMDRDALNWGQNLVDSLITGLRNKATALGQAAGNLADELKKKLGFHSPAAEGPGADADQWAPNFVRMFNAGLLAGIPQIGRTAGLIAGALAGGITNNHTTYGATTINNSIASLSVAQFAQLLQMMSGGASANGAYSNLLRAPGGYKQFGAIGGVLG